jgi:hypothetical protein
MSAKQPMQPRGRPSGRGPSPSSGRGQGGESGGGAYPNPHKGQAPKDGFMAHGGQTDIDQKLKPGEPED